MYELRGGGGYETGVVKVLKATTDTTADLVNDAG